MSIFLWFFDDFCLDVYILLILVEVPPRFIHQLSTRAVLSIKYAVFVHGAYSRPDGQGWPEQGTCKNTMALVDIHPNCIAWTVALRIKTRLNLSMIEDPRSFVCKSIKESQSTKTLVHQMRDIGDKSIKMLLLAFLA